MNKSEHAIQIIYVNIFVSDLPRAVEFYQGKLGLELEFSSPEHGYASFSAGAVRLGIAVPGPDEAALVGRHTGVGMDVANLDSEYKRLTELGVNFTMSPTRQPWGGFMALMSDPDGNIFYLDQTSVVHGQ